MAKVYTVRNDSGDTHQVDEDKISLAEKDGYLCVVSNGQAEHRVSVADFHLAMKDGFKPLVDLTGMDYIKGKARELPETISDTWESIKEGIPLHGAAEKLGMAINASLPDFIQPDQDKGKSWSDIYNAQLAEDKKERDDRFARSPIASNVGNIAGAFVAPNPASITGRIALNVADAATRGDTLNEAGDNALVAGGISSAFEALPLVGKGLKAAKRLLPGTEDALPLTNKITSKAASLLPNQDASADEIYELLNNPNLRRQARNTDLLTETNRVLPKVDEAFNVADDAVSKRFNVLENDSLYKEVGLEGVGKDIEALLDMTIKTQPIFNKIKESSDFYGPASKKISKQTQEILNGNNPLEYGKDTYKKTLKEIFNSGKTYEEQAQLSGVMKKRVLHARRNLDDFMKNKNYENLSKYEREAIQDIRDSLAHPLKEAFTGAAERSKADDLYSQYRSAADDLKQFTTKRGDEEVAIEKLYNSLRSSSAKGVEFDKRADKFINFFNQNEDQLGKLPEVEEALASVKELRNVGAMGRMIEDAKRAGGGPTSQAVNMALQIAGGVFSGGYSLLFLPITNPAGWAKVLDSLAEYGQHDVINKLQKASKAIMEKAPNIATRAYLLDKHSGKEHP